MKRSQIRSKSDWRRWSTIALLASLVLISVVNTGYRYYCDNHALQLPLVEWVLEPDLFPADPFVETLVDYESWVWWGVAQLSRAIDLRWVLLTLFILTRTLLIYSCSRVGSALVSDSPEVLFSAAALGALAPQSILGNGNLTEVYFEQTSMFMPLFMLALANLLERKTAWFFLLWALAFLINPMYGSWAGLFFFGTYLADPERPSWKALAKAAPIFLVMVTPIVVEGVRALSQPKPDPELWSWAIRVLNSPHLAPSTWEPVQFYRFACFVLLVLTVGFLVRRWFRRVHLLTTIWSLLAVGFLALGIMVGRSERWLEVLVLQPARATDLFYLSAGVAIIAATTELLVRNPTGPRFLLFIGTFSGTGYLLAPSLRNRAVWPALAVVTLVAGVFAFWRFRASARMSTGTPWWRAALSQPVLPGLLLLGILLLAMVGNFQERAEKWGSGTKALYRGPDRQIATIAAWARSSTPEDAVFLHDPIHWEWAQFRYLAHRPVYATWKDASAVLWAPHYTEEWSRRFAALGFRGQWREHWDIAQRGEIDKMRQSMRRHARRLRDKNIEAVRKDFDIDYWIAPQSARSKYPVVFETENYQVFQLD